MSGRRRTQSLSAYRPRLAPQRARSAPATVSKDELSYVPAQHDNCRTHLGKLLLHRIEIQHYTFHEPEYNETYYGRNPNPYCIPQDKFDGFLMKECELTGENTVIKGKAFVNCQNLKIVTFPRSSLFYIHMEVVFVDDAREGYETYGIFHNCPELKKVIISGNFNTFEEARQMICEPTPGQDIDPYCDRLKTKLEAGIQTTFLRDGKPITCVWGWPNNNPREREHQRIITTFHKLELTFIDSGGNHKKITLPDEECDIIQLLKNTHQDLGDFVGILNPFNQTDPLPMKFLFTSMLGNHLLDNNELITTFTLVYLDEAQKAKKKKTRRKSTFNVLTPGGRKYVRRTFSAGGGKSKRKNNNRKNRNSKKKFNL